MEPKATTTLSDRTFGLIGVALVLAWAFIALYVVSTALPFNPVRLPYAPTLRTEQWAPEGWGFFTRDPREERALPFALRDGAWVSASNGPHGRASNVFGLNRVSRAQGVEVALLVWNFPDSAWQPCERAIAECFQHMADARIIKNRSPEPTLCGFVGVALQRPVPWAWTQSRREFVMPSRVIRFAAKC